MSTPIRQGELSPEDPKFYAPPKWRSGEVTAAPTQHSLSAPEHPTSEAYADRVSHHDEMSLDNEPIADAFLKSRQQSENLDYGSVRTKTLAIAAGVVAWTAYCIIVGLGRLDTISFAQLRNGLPSASNPEISASEQPQAANSPLHPENNALLSRRLSTPMLTAADAIGEMKAALPLAIKVSNYTPGATINLTGLIAGTTLSAGSAAGESQWRIAIDDLPNIQVIPPADFVGAMTIVAELRAGDDQAIVRTPLQLVWRPVAIKSEEPAEPLPSPAFAVAEDNRPKDAPVTQALALQKESAVTEPSQRLGARKHISRGTKTSSLKKQNLAKKRQQNPSSALMMETDTVSRWQLVPSSNYTISTYSDAHVDRGPFWNNGAFSRLAR